MNNQENVNDVTSLWKLYEDGVAYLGNTGLRKRIPQFVDFYEGRQWPAPTKLTKNMPRPVINIIKMICRSKKAAILSTPVKIVYQAEDESVDVDTFNRFAEYIQKEIGQSKLDSDAISDGVKKGCYFYHYYWDSEARGKDGMKEGALRCEIIHALDILFADPTQTDEQKQEWIMIISRENVDSVRAKADKGVAPELIRCDEANDRYTVIEQEGSKLCTVLTRYFRKGGEVYCEKAVKGAVINAPFPIAPDIEAARRELGIDAPNNALPDNHEGEPLITDKVRAHLYPIVVGNYEKREKSIYGLSEVEGLIPNQKAINFHVAMTLYNNQQLAWGKYIVLPGALGSQTITNEPGQTLTDYSKTGNGIRKMQEQQLQSQPMAIVDAIMQMTRNVSGATEVMTGEAIGANMSGAAIAQLQSQAQMPIEDLRNTFWQVKEKQGRVLAQFFKLFYQGKEFTYTDGAGENEQVMIGEFNGEAFQNVDFDVVVETTKGTQSSTAGDINLLDVLFKAGALDAKGYINAFPSDAISNKSELLRAIEEKEQSAMLMMQQQIAQYEQQLGQAQQVIEQQKGTVDRVVSLIQENNRLNQVIANLYAEARGKLQLANQQIQAANGQILADQAKINEVTEDATAFAQHIAQHEGVLNDE
ncbi:MAG: hypothetical protein IKB51_03980 [Clostridia bacterium]|nr:hypothetical protein [Clostridia bacterium]